MGGQLGKLRPQLHFIASKLSGCTAFIPGGQLHLAPSQFPNVSCAIMLTLGSQLAHSVCSLGLSQLVNWLVTLKSQPLLARFITAQHYQHYRVEQLMIHWVCNLASKFKWCISTLCYLQFVYGQHVARNLMTNGSCCQFTSLVGNVSVSLSTRQV